MNITIPEDAVVHLSQHAQIELATATNAYVKDLLEEASRLEAVSREGEGAPEITRVHIKDSTILLKRYPQKKNKSWGFTIVQLIATSTTLYAGILFPDTPEKQQNMTAWFIFVLIFGLALIFSTLQIIFGRNQ